MELEEALVWARIFTCNDCFRLLCHATDVTWVLASAGCERHVSTWHLWGTTLEVLFH